MRKLFILTAFFCSTFLQLHSQNTFNKVIADADIIRQFVVDDIHAGEYVTENAFTTTEFAPNTIMTNGVIDPFFANGGFQFAPMHKKKVKIYVIAIDFPDCIGNLYIPYNRHRNVFKANHSIYDLTDPQTHFDAIFNGSDGLKANRKFDWQGTAEQEYKGIVQLLQEQSMGLCQVEVVCLNELYARQQDLDPKTDKWPWFRVNAPMIGYSVAGPADCEDYRQFSRLHQAGIDAAYKYLDEPGRPLDIEDIDFIYTITPYNVFGHRSGFQGGGGLQTSFSFNDQSLLHRDNEYRHEPGVKTRNGRMVGSGVFGVKGVINQNNPNPRNVLHELTHGLGFFDDYSYNRIGANTGESSAPANQGYNTGDWGVMGGSMSSLSPDMPAWRKFRMGWLKDDEMQVILPGETVTVYLRALGSYAGDGGSYTDNPNIKTKMVVIPKEWRTRDTYGIDWDNGYNPYKNDYNWFDWFTNPFVGGETNAIKSFPTFYTLECRKPLGADGNPKGRDSGLPDERKGVVVGYVANPTWETGHGGGGFRVMFPGNNALQTEQTFEDPHLGLIVKVLESNDFYDKVEITYKGKSTSGAKHVYQGLLTISDNYVQANESFTADFHIFTIGTPASNDERANPVSSAVMRVPTPLGVPGGIAGFKMNVSFDAANLEYVPTGYTSPFIVHIDASKAASGTLTVTGVGDKMVNKENILSLNFKTKRRAVQKDYTINATITDVTLFNWRGEKLEKGDAGFDDVGTFGNGTLAALYNTVADNTYTPGIKSTGGKVALGRNATFTVKGKITCDTPGPAPETFIGVESAVTLYNNNNAVVATTKSDWDGNYILKGVPAGEDYYVTAEKSKYFDGRTAVFGISANTAVPALKLIRETYTVSGAIYGSNKSDGSGATPLAGVKVYVVSIGNAYKILGGPVTTASDGTYTIQATTDNTEKPFAALAVEANGAAKEYGVQLRLKNEGLDLNLGMMYGIDPSDYIYPANAERYGVGGSYNFFLGGANSARVTGRNLTLVKTQDVHLRTATKSTDIYYQLMMIDGVPAGAKVQSKGTENGDDVIRNVAPGTYYIEVTRNGYVSVCTMPFSVSDTRVFLRDAQATNTLDINTPAGENIVSGAVTDKLTGRPLRDVRIEFVSWSVNGGKGLPVYSGADGKFKYDVLADDKAIIFSKDGYTTQTIHLTSGGEAGLKIALEPTTYGYNLQPNR